jgi:hypothetical protein
LDSVILSLSKDQFGLTLPPMVEAILPFVFGLVLTALIAWFVLVARAFNLLRNTHPATYEKLGSPSLFYNNSIKNNFLFLKFLFQNEFETLNDPSLANLCRLMKIFLAGYAILFLVMAGLILNVIICHPLKPQN